MILAYRALKKRQQRKKEAAATPALVEQSEPITTNENVTDSQTTAAEPQSYDGADGQILTEPKENVGAPKRTPEEKRADRIYRFKIIFGLFFPFALQALDVTIIASALPWIASDFNEVSQLNWIISAFSLTSAVFIPSWGQLADILGRHTTFQASIILMLIGSALCTGAPTSAFPMLLVGRALQGWGCSGINLLTKVILADKVSLEENSKNTSVFSLVAGISYALGPTAGGYLTAKSWRWAFAINLPIAVVGILLTVLILRPLLLGAQPLAEFRDSLDVDRNPSVWSRLATIDIGGQFLFLFGVGLMILAFTWAGSTYAWSSANVIAPLVIGVIIFVLFIIWEYLMEPGKLLARKFPRQRPMISWDLMINRNSALLMYANFATGLAMYAVFYFVDIYFTLVKDYDSSKSGIQLLFYTPGLGVGVYLAIFFCNTWPGKTWYPLFLGSVIEATGITALAFALKQKDEGFIYGMLAVAGCGTGLRLMPGTLHGVAFFSRRIASIVSLMSLALPFGGAVGTTIMSTVFNNRLSSSTSSSTSISATTSFNDIDKLPADQQTAIRDSANTAIFWAFISIVPLCWLCVLAVLGLGNAKIKDQHAPKFYEDGTRDFRDDIYEGVYIWKMITRRKGSVEKPERV